VVAAVTVVAEPRIHYVLPGGVDVAGTGSRYEGSGNGVQSVGRNAAGDLGAVGRIAHVGHPGQRRVIARDRGREFEEDTVPSYDLPIRPGDVLLQQRVPEPDEGRHAWVVTAVSDHRAVDGGRNVTGVDPHPDRIQAG
jgi:hypothetical protein